VWLLLAFTPRACATMDRPALRANENVPAPLVRQLRERELTLHAVADLMPIASDRAVLLHAYLRGLRVLTFDRDYGELVFARPVTAPPAIVFLRQGPQPMAEFAQAVAFAHMPTALDHE